MAEAGLGIYAATHKTEIQQKIGKSIHKSIVNRENAKEIDWIQKQVS